MASKSLCLWPALGKPIKPFCALKTLYTARSSAMLYCTEGLKEYPVSLSSRQEATPKALKELLTIVSSESID